MGSLVHVEMPTAQYLSVRGTSSRCRVSFQLPCQLYRSTHHETFRKAASMLQPCVLGRSLQLDIQRSHPSPPATCAGVGLPFIVLTD